MYQFGGVFGRKLHTEPTRTHKYYSESHDKSSSFTPHRLCKISHTKSTTNCRTSESGSSLVYDGYAHRNVPQRNAFDSATECIYKLVSKYSPESFRILFLAFGL